MANFGTTDADWASCSATPPTPKWTQGGSGTDCILFNNNANNPTKLQVVLPSKHVDSFFGGLVGYGGMDISARAQATIREDDVPGCALCVQGTLDTSGPVEVRPGSPRRPVAARQSAGSGVVRTGGTITVAARRCHHVCQRDRPQATERLHVFTGSAVPATGDRPVRGQPDAQRAQAAASLPVFPRPRRPRRRVTVAVTG